MTCPADDDKMGKALGDSHRQTAGSWFLASGRSAVPASHSGDPSETIIFGQFVLKPTQRLLLRDGEPVRLSSRALDILCLLVERAGQIVSKDEILARVWHKTFIADGNLRVHIAGLRKALGDGRDDQRFIVNVPNRGYSFVETIQHGASEVASRTAASDLSARPAPVSRPLPILQNRVIGREQALRALAELVSQRRLVTIVGAGGVGKTTFAIAAVAALLENPDARRWHRVCFVDLASLTDACLVPTALFSALGMAAPADVSLSSLMTYLRDKDTLILLDNCEHVIGAVADLVEAILVNAPKAHILTTSREPLRIEGERIYRLPPLSMPPQISDIRSDEAMAYPAIELFVDRARARSELFVFRDEDVAVVIEICRRLDGIPLALELAAGRIDVFGLRGLATALDSLFAVLTKGRRTALPRHQTLHATLDWSFNLLGQRDRRLAQRLSVFSGSFTLDSATAVAAWGALDASDVAEGISDLVAQSLVSVDASRSETCYRLLETTRAYARAKLAGDPDASQVSRRLAEHCCDLLGEKEVVWSEGLLSDWRDKYGWLIDDLRASLSWAYKPHGDPDLGVTLTVAAVPLWFQLSLINECRDWVEQALSVLSIEEDRSDSVAMKLHAARGWSLMYTAGPAREAGDAWTQAYQLAKRLDDTDYRLRALWGLWAGKMNNAEFVAARNIAVRFSTLAPASPHSIDRAIGDRLLGTSLHFLGDQSGARLHIERMLGSYLPPSHRSHVVRYQFDPRITAKMTLSRVLWLQGLADEALHTVDTSVDEALGIGHQLSLCNTLAQAACPVALLAGDLERAERFTNILLKETERPGLDIWHIYASCFRGQIMVQRGDVAAGLALIQAAVNELRKACFVQYYSTFLVALANGFIAAGWLSEANAAIDEALEQAERTNERWATPEMLRLKGEIALLSSGERNAVPVEEYFVQSMDLAQQQNALAWTLRAATSLARLKREQSSPSEALELLAPIYDRFTEGFETRDLTIAKALLEELR